ncbi:hypothetical protein GLOTRDRAFT_68163 [Gloeophyllum trabeum ATCC 11539]|uniref:RRM domain-containing protein n=1 Tax=Gloeophyllum trabeum (strain ATCC 11539 / FP-39264 / Madison 617) TaxID=670483 RepID=S7RZQ4_GLOTA|nr:uncharacterized protein GLOTRDRAFT_68163 [Gloeophyllum trabeum ATCC 11539]EPQ60495.1 hypothetical protein GLOTRDRAFT_68163 [Gloeophyllum trabeum ATCC 11539]
MSSQKLTKKQKKAIAFRERKGKGKAQASLDDGSNDIPVQEDQELASLQAADVEREEKHTRHKDDHPAAAGPGGELVGKARKRKREQDAEGKSKETEGQAEQEEGAQTPAKKKRRASKGVEEGKGKAESDAQEKDLKKEKARYILFVGNLKYTTSYEAIREHFSVCDPPPTIRLLTPKSKNGPQPSTAKSKGCAFLEFPSKNSLQQALKLHHSTLDGRKINVELTAGGGGKSEQRLNKLKQRNKELEAQRKKRLEKKKTDQTEAPADESAQGARFSSTSGVGDAPGSTRTWTVGDDAGDRKKRKRGSKQKSGAKRPSFLATGVNAIPVG